MRTPSSAPISSLGCTPGQVIYRNLFDDFISALRIPRVLHSVEVDQKKQKNSFAQIFQHVSPDGLPTYNHHLRGFRFSPPIGNSLHFWGFSIVPSFYSQKNLKMRGAIEICISQKKVGQPPHLLVLEVIKSWISLSTCFPGLGRAWWTPDLCLLGLAPAKALGTSIEWCPAVQASLRLGSSKVYVSLPACGRVILGGEVRLPGWAHCELHSRAACCQGNRSGPAHRGLQRWLNSYLDGPTLTACRGWHKRTLIPE